MEFGGGWKHLNQLHMNKGNVTQMCILFFKTSIYRLGFLIGQQFSSVPFENEYKWLPVLEFTQSGFEAPRAT